MLAEIAKHLNPIRQHRRVTRCVKRKMSNYRRKPPGMKSPARRPPAEVTLAVH